MSRPIVLDGYCGLGGWSEGFISEGWDCIGIDLERHDYGTGGYPGKLILRDMLTVHGSEFKHVDCIVMSPPCQFFSYTAMPWSRAKQLAKDVRYDPVRLEKELALFKACFRIQREAIEAAGHFIPMVVENVRGAQPWVGKARWNFGSFYLWGDVPALMPITMKRGVMKQGIAHQPNGETNFHGVRKISEAHRSKSPAKGYGAVTEDGQKSCGHLTNQAESDGVKQAGISGVRDNGKGDKWFQDGAAQSGSKSPARKAASATIAKIPLPLARWIAKVYLPK